MTQLRHLSDSETLKSLLALYPQKHIFLLVSAHVVKIHWLYPQALAYCSLYGDTYIFTE